MSCSVSLSVLVSDRRGQPTIRDVDFGDGGQKSRRSSGLRFQFNKIYFLSRLEFYKSTNKHKTKYFKQKQSFNSKMQRNSVTF